ncbi:MAG: hypothetical protein JJT75_05375 [Opitutales bacterium]|nr:hypothetical protein [Opitutales bacterium]MCH8541330.1 hypothetical protein [Opitutales bacterium]
MKPSSTSSSSSEKFRPANLPGARPKSKPIIALQIFTAAMVLGIFAFFLRPGFDLGNFLQGLQDLGPLWFYVGLSILPLFFVPTSPFYFLAGAAYPLWVNLIGLSAAVLVNMILAYLLGMFVLRSFSLRMAERIRGKPLVVKKNRAWGFAFLIKMAPGISPTLKSYIMSAAGIPFGIYIVISWSITMFYALGITLFGASFQEENRGGMIALGLVFLGTVVFFTWYVRRYLRASRMIEEE